MYGGRPPSYVYPTGRPPSHGYPTAADDPVTRPLFDAFYRFERHNLGSTSGWSGQTPGSGANLTHEQASNVFTALRNVFAHDLPSATHVLDFFASRRFRRATDEELENLDLFRPQGYNAVAAESGGTVTVRPDFFDLPEGERVGLLLHEMSHTKHTASFAGTGGNADEEGEAYGIEYATLERAGGTAARLQWLRANADSGWGEVTVGIPAAKAAFNRSYRALRVLYDIIDHARSPHGELRLSRDEARQVMWELLESNERSAAARRVLDWVDRYGDRIQAPLR